LIQLNKGKKGKNAKAGSASLSLTLLSCERGKWIDQPTCQVYEILQTCKKGGNCGWNKKGKRTTGHHVGIFLSVAIGGRMREKR